MSLSTKPPLDTTRFIARHVSGLRRSGIRDFFELVAKNPLASVERILEAHELSLEAGELLRREKGLGKKALQAAGAGDHFAVLGRKLFEAEHDGAVVENTDDGFFAVLGGDGGLACCCGCLLPGLCLRRLQHQHVHLRRA